MGHAMAVIYLISFQRQGLQKLNIFNTDQFFLVGESTKISNILETNLSSY